MATIEITGGDDAIGNGSHQLRSGANARRAGTVDLDADHVGGADEARPGVGLAGIAGKGPDACREHLADGVAVHLPGRGIDGFLGPHAHGQAGIRPRHPRLR